MSQFDYVFIVAEIYLFEHLSALGKHTVVIPKYPSSVVEKVYPLYAASIESLADGYGVVMARFHKQKVAAAVQKEGDLVKILDVSRVDYLFPLCLYAEGEGLPRSLALTQMTVVYGAYADASVLKQNSVAYAP